MSVCLALMLTNCATFGQNRVQPNPLATLDPIPSDIQVCFDKVVPRPKKGPMTKSETIKHIGTLLESDLMKSECGHRLIAFYNNQRVSTLK